MAGKKVIKKLGQNKDITFRWITDIDPDLEQWRSLAEEYFATVRLGRNHCIRAMAKFIFDYIHEQNLSKVPSEFLRRDYIIADSFYDSCLSQISTNTGKKYLKHTSNFIDWVLNNYFSIEDDYNEKVIPREYNNPLLSDISSTAPELGYTNYSESDKNPLPYFYIRQLRSILCPEDALSFKDWKWAQNAFDYAKNGGGDWFMVDYSIIDKDDTDCFWRKRKTTEYEQRVKEMPSTIYELWSPVRSVALYLKLMLPLRTYQVRMLDSGESDTYRYDQPELNEAGKWIINSHSLKEGSEKHPVKRGVFRKFHDPVTKIDMTGFYINTNKTADINKPEWAKGYNIPWQYEEVLYWLAKLRNWQEKYNPIDKPTQWLDLEYKHIGSKSMPILKQMGSTCFLFRDASSEDDNKKSPISDQNLSSLWHKLLSDLEKKCNTVEIGTEIPTLKFIKNESTTLYPLHSLRVSLITAYALEGGVPMPILSKCIAGHARLLMTLYYTKAGITYVTDMMGEAEKKLAEQEQEAYNRWIREATYSELEVYAATNDPASLQAIINAQQSRASIIKDDKGICPKGCMGCDTGGIYCNDDTGKTSYGVVPGYPEQNCVRCRWFLTGPAFLPGLVHHFNAIGYDMGETSERVIHFQNEIEKLENLKFECEQSDLPFLENERLLKFEKLHQQEVQKNDKLANDYNAALRLIDRCIKISEELKDNEQVQFVAVGTMDDVRVSIDDVPNKLFQIQTICNGAVIFPETDSSKAVLQRSQILDLTLAMNNRKPVFFSLTPEQQLVAGNAWVQLLMKRAGSLKDAVPYIEGRRKLIELGLDLEVDNLIQAVNVQNSYALDNETKMIEISTTEGVS